MEYENVPAADWQEWTAQEGAVILDVREPGEWELGTLPNSMMMSMRDLPARVHELSKDTPVLVVCRTGDRSAQVASYLAFNGYTTVANMTGGLTALGMRT